MALVTLSSDKWNAEILVSDQPGEAGFIHVQAKVLGDSMEDALTGAKQILDKYAAGKLAYIRAKPEAHSDRDFDTKIVVHRGWVRFSYKDEPGEWNYPESFMPIPSFGELH